MRMALELGGGRRLVDPFGGPADLARRLVRTLHPRSFRDDPDPRLSRRALREPPRLSPRAGDAARARGGARAAARSTRSPGTGCAGSCASSSRSRDRAGALARLEAAGIDGAIDPALRRRPGARGRAAPPGTEDGATGSGVVGDVSPRVDGAVLRRRGGVDGGAPFASRAARPGRCEAGRPCSRRWRPPRKAPVAALRRALRDAGPDAAVAAEASLPPRDGEGAPGPAGFARAAALDPRRRPARGRRSLGPRDRRGRSPAPSPRVEEGRDRSMPEELAFALRAAAARRAP